MAIRSVEEYAECPSHRRLVIWCSPHVRFPSQRLTITTLTQGNLMTATEGQPLFGVNSSATPAGLKSLKLWPLSILIGFPIAGYIADLVVDGVDSVGAAIVAGLIAGAIFGAAEWFVLRRWVSWLWIPATAAGTAIGLAAGAVLVDYGISRPELALMGAVTGLGVGVMQALVLARHQFSGALWWALANPPGWALGWFVTSYVIARNIAERFPIFGASGAIVFGLLTWVLLAMVLRGTTPEGGRAAAPAAS
jgi:hypothetical protein